MKRQIKSACGSLVAVLFAACSFLSTSAGASTLDQAAEQFKPYVLRQIAQSLAAATQLRDCIKSHDLAAAQRAWLAARNGWESAEVVSTEFFPELDSAIDAWPNAARGFHAIEAKLFGAHTLDALPAAEELVNNIKEFEERLRSTSLTAQGLLNGTAKLAYEIGEDKADGGESQFSGNSLAEMGSNIAAIKAAYAQVFAPRIKARDVKHARTVAAHIDQLQALLATPKLIDLDPTQLRTLSETLAIDLQKTSIVIGLKSPDLAN